MSNDLDELMARDPLELSAQDIDKIINYHRTARARKASGEKPVRTSSSNVDLSEVSKKLLTKVQPACDRRI